MPAVTGGTGFVGFGDYENANQQSTQNLANQVEAQNTATNAADTSALNSAEANVESEVNPYLQTAASNASAADPNPASFQPTVTKNYTYNQGTNTETNKTNEQTSPYLGFTQQQANYLSAEPGASSQVGNDLKGVNLQDPNNPYSVNNSKTIANLEANPNQLSGYGAFTGAQQQQQTDLQQQANQNTWGGAFGALQTLQTPNAAGAYGSAAGTGTGFDASLVQGRLGDAAQAAQNAEGTGPSTNQLNAGIATAAGQAGQASNNFFNEPALQPAAPQSAAKLATPGKQSAPPVTPLLPNTQRYPGQGFSGTPGGTY